MPAVTPGFCLQTERLVLRDWRDDDLAPLHQICSDPLVMATIGPLQDREAARAGLARLMARAARDGHTFWALERKSDGRMIGFCGLAKGTVPQIENDIEIGWRLASDCWGQSYAREAAQASLAWMAANRPGEPVCAITSVGNVRSRGLMERLGMRRDPAMDFDHPNVPEGSPLKAHVTYWLDEPR
jgi:RimJ/RimL family protein N-acetyltransferase